MLLREIGSEERIREEMTIAVGVKAEAQTFVSETNTAKAMGSGELPVFATPAMIAVMEKAAVRAVAPHLEEGQQTVGVHVDVRHLGATPIGKRVWAIAQVTAVDGRRITFSVQAFDQAEKVGEGTHERVIVDAEQFIWRVASKGI
jgi:fluoroacetyl-CoA thioesterase